MFVRFGKVSLGVGKGGFSCLFGSFVAESQRVVRLRAGVLFNVGTGAQKAGGQSRGNKNSGYLHKFTPHHNVMLPAAFVSARKLLLPSILLNIFKEYNNFVGVVNFA